MKKKQILSEKIEKLKKNEKKTTQIIKNLLERSKKSLEKYKKLIEITQNLKKLIQYFIANCSEPKNR